MSQGRREKAPLKILFIQGVSRYGGALRSLFHTMRLLKKKGHHPVLITSKRGRLTEECEAEGIDYYTVKMGMWRKVKSWPFLPFVFFRLVGIAKREGVHIVHCNTLWDAPHGLVLGAILGLPVVVHLRNVHARGLLDKYYVRYADLIVGVSFACLKFFNPEEMARACVIYNPLEEMRPCGDVVASAIPTLAVVGRVDTTKGQLEFVEEVFRPLREKIKLRLFVVGEASSKEKWLEERMREYQKDFGGEFVFTGAVRDVKSYYCLADVVAVPSKEEALEGLPRVVVEAASLGRFICATSSGGTGELVFDKTGFLVKEIRNLIAVSRFVFLPKVRKKLGLNARRKVFGMCSAETHMRRLVDRGYLLCLGYDSTL